MADNIFREISSLIMAKESVVFLHSWEEERIVKILKLISEKQFSKPLDFYLWSISDGAYKNGKQFSIDNGDLRDLNGFLDYIKALKGNAVFALKDVPNLWKDDVLIKRKIRDIYNGSKNNYRTVFIISNEQDIPSELTKEITYYDFPYPSYDEIKLIFLSVLNEVRKKNNVKISIGEEDMSAFVRGALGLTLDEARSAYSKAFMDETHIRKDLVVRVLKEKKFLIDRTPGLVYVDDVNSINDVGGLEALKEWLLERIKCFTPEAEKYKIVPPKGLLITGVSGCGKSYIVRGIAGLWDMPLIRLDMNQIYSEGSTPGRNFDMALKTVEAVSPALLWIDEIEKALGESGDDEASRIFGTFLTWMQEKTKPVFVVATANKIEMLPAEMLRKGRFDDIFFVDLPTAEEREDIFRVHLANRNLNAEEYDLQGLRASTEGYSGSEIEQIIISSVFTAFVRGEKATQEDFYKTISKSIPLSVTMAEDVKNLRRWASSRAIFAGKERNLT